MTAQPQAVGLADVAILGGGSGGYACALRAAELGLTVVLVERDLLGGTCLHRGCIPTKAFLHAAEVADAARDASQVGVRATFDGVDLPAVRSYADGVVKRLHSGLSGLVAQRGIRVVEGAGRLVRDGHGVGLEVFPNDGTPSQTLRARAVVLATGSAPRTLGLEIDGSRLLTSDDALRLPQLPTSAVVLGGGVIGVEFASAWRSFGVEVTIVEALDRLVPAEEPEVSAALARAFGKRGIEVVTGSPMRSVQLTDAGVRVELESNRAVEADLVLVAVGRGPVSLGLGFEDAGVRLDRGWVRVDDNLATGVPGVYAVGDLVPGPQLAHRGFGHGIFVAERIAHLAGVLRERPRLQPDHLVPKVTYSDPQVASVGLTEAQAAERGPVATQVYTLAGNGRAQILRTSGLVKVVTAVDGPVLGVHLVGAGVGELVGEAQLITGWEALPSEVAQFVHAHPTLDEALGEAFLALAGKPLHVHH